MSGAASPVDQVLAQAGRGRVSPCGVPITLGWACAVLLGLAAGSTIVTSLALFRDFDEDMPATTTSEETPLTPNSLAPSYTQVCSTQSCQYASEAIRLAVDFSLNPCGDFFEFVCSKYSVHNPQIFEGEDHDSALSYIRTLLYSVSVPVNRPQTAIQKAAAMYRACMKLFEPPSIDMKSSLQRLMNGVGVQLLPSQSADSVELEIVIHLALQYNLQTMLSIVIGNPLAWGHGRLLEISLNNEVIEWFDARWKLTDSEKESVYKNYLSIFDPSIQADQTATNLLAIETRFHGILTSLSNKGTHKFTTVENLSQDTAGITSGRWTAAIRTYSGNHLDGKSIAYAETSSLTFIDSILSNVDSSDTKLFIAWTLLKNYGRYVNSDLLRLDARGPTRKTAAQDICTARVSEVLPVAFSAVYFHKVVSPLAISTVKDILRGMRETYIVAVKNSSSLDGTFRSLASAKLRAISFYPGFPKLLRTQAGLSYYYSKYPDVGDDFFASWLASSKVRQQKKLADETTTILPAFQGKIFYAVSSNKMVIPPSGIRPPLFMPDAPLSLTCGGLGAVIAREIMHGYDADGRQERWWSPAVFKNYSEQVSCLMEAFKSVTGRWAPAPSSFTDSVYVADLVGLRMAAVTFRNRHSRSDAMLPGLPLTPMQLFFIAYCYKWCSSPEGMSGSSRDFPRNKGRCNVPVMNIAEFAKAFSCKRGDRMNPRKKCFVL